MCALQLFLNADPSLGRVDYSSLSDQTLMEMLVEGLDDETKQEYQDDDGAYLEVCDWPCVKCDVSERVIEIGVDSSDIRGSIQLCYVPPKVKVLKVTPSFPGSELSGSVDLTQLPVGMQVLDLQNNILTGEVDLTRLPSETESLSLGHNQLTWEINITQLPDGMQKLFLDNNQLTGKVDLTKLPKGMNVLRLQYNQFTGAIDLGNLPDEMTYLFLQNNKFSGSFVAKGLASSMAINAQGNQFNAVAVIGSKTDAAIKLRGSGVTSVVDENGKEMDMNRFFE